MTDDEINKRVAEIEGFPDFANDWTWCGPLVEKYKVKVWWDGQDWAAQIVDDSALEWADTPQRAICLAVIAAHEGK